MHYYAVIHRIVISNSTCNCICCRAAHLHVNFNDVVIHFQNQIQVADFLSGRKFYISLFYKNTIALFTRYVLTDMFGADDKTYHVNWENIRHMSTDGIELVPIRSV